MKEETMLETIEKLTAELRRVDGDKPATHHTVKELIATLKTLEKQTQPGIGEFKWTATARKGLMKPANGKHQNPSLIVARGDGEVWHSDGHYMVKGEPSKRFEPFDTQELPIRAVKQIIPHDMSAYETVTVIGGTDKVPDAVELSNGAYVNRLYLAYVTATAGEGATLHGNGKLSPVVVRVNGETVGLVMSLNPAYAGKK